MISYLDFNDKQYKEIPKGAITDGDYFLCQTINFYDPFNSWDYAVAQKTDSRTVVLGTFKELRMAQIFASAVCQIKEDDGQ